MIVYVILICVALHFVFGMVVYFVAIDQEERAALAVVIAENKKKLQAEDDRIDALRKQREAVYNARFCPTTIMPLTDPNKVNK